MQTTSVFKSSTYYLILSLFLMSNSCINFPVFIENTTENSFKIEAEYYSKSKRGYELKGKGMERVSANSESYVSIQKGRYSSLNQLDSIFIKVTPTGNIINKKVMIQKRLINSEAPQFITLQFDTDTLFVNLPRSFSAFPLGIKYNPKRN
ncbi:hypothetical protein [Flammeovirga aprica]|uniref:Uncharacterized protein n=1 Tax=Flammeovirga aprica JL-4 TaxID=694437 RepID=A0A7X9RUV5_9BACT|nr:hypothetical protein [Flammeovirga aprica]NME69135.1 hypothetical protein [Flammeovirga aprica JL-4]